MRQQRTHDLCLAFHIDFLYAIWIDIGIYHKKLNHLFSIVLDLFVL